MFGFLVNRIIKTAGELSEKGQFSLQNLGSRIIKDLAVVGGIYIGINGGFTGILSTLLKLSGLFARLAVKNIIMRPLNLLLGAVKGVFTKLGAVLGGITFPSLMNAGAKAAAPVLQQGLPIAAGAGAMMQQGQQRPAPAPTRGRSPGVPAPRLAGPIAAIFNFATGGSLGESLTAGGLALAPRLLGMTGPFGLAASIGLPFLANMAYRQIQPSAESFIPQLGFTRDDLFKTLIQSAKRNSPKVNVVNLDGGTKGNQQNIPATLGGSTELPIVSSSNPSNFYLMYSQIQYNVVG